MSEFFDPGKEQSNAERLDYCPHCEGNFLDFKAGEPIRRYDDEWLLSLECNDCGFQEHMGASDEGLTAFNIERGDTSLGMFTESLKIEKMSLSTFMGELEKSGMLPPIEPLA